MSEKTEDVWEKLRAPFDPKIVGLLPKVSCYSCTQITKTAKSPLDKHCDRHRMIKCDKCGAYITEGHIHLDYVGHAAVTDRLNNAVGPDKWFWEPLSVDEFGMPRLDSQGNLWIRLTVMDASRIGYGDGSQNIKELIGDALRNAAMRFGVALDLWSKEELESTLDDPSSKNVKPTEAPKAAPERPEPSSTIILANKVQIGRMMQAAKEASGLDIRNDIIAWFTATTGFEPMSVPAHEVDEVMKHLKEVAMENVKGAIESFAPGVES